jgi:probable F420-dependent oxidoreductase
MEFGIGHFATDQTVDPLTLGRLVEERGFESLFLAEHTHIPASRETPYPAGGDLPPEYWRTLDPFVALSAIASVTEKLRLGTGICLIVQRDPIITANETASVDWISGGRFLFGVGAGWNLEEMRHHGTDPGRRFGLMRERVEAVKAIWTEEEASYHGRHVNFDRVLSWPKPVQKPHPPVLVAGHGPGVIDRVLAFGDEWLPNAIGDHDKIRDRIRRLREAGKPTTIAAAPTDVAELRAYEEAGAHRAFWWVAQGERADIERRLDRLAALVAEYRGG